jgi:uncharacterized protein YggL (DUF469 family)
MEISTETNGEQQTNAASRSFGPSNLPTGITVELLCQQPPSWVKGIQDSTKRWLCTNLVRATQKKTLLENALNKEINYAKPTTLNTQYNHLLPQVKEIVEESDRVLQKQIRVYYRQKLTVEYNNMLTRCTEDAALVFQREQVREFVKDLNQQDIATYMRYFSTEVEPRHCLVLRDILILAKGNWQQFLLAHKAVPAVQRFGEPPETRPIRPASPWVPDERDVSRRVTSSFMSQNPFDLLSLDRSQIDQPVSTARLIPKGRANPNPTLNPSQNSTLKVSKPKSGVRLHNLTHSVLPSQIKSFLNKGYKYIPSLKPNRHVLVNSFVSAALKLRDRYRNTVSPMLIDAVIGVEKDRLKYVSSNFSVSLTDSTKPISTENPTNKRKLAKKPTQREFSKLNNFVNTGSNQNFRCSKERYLEDLPDDVLYRPRQQGDVSKKRQNIFCDHFRTSKIQKDDSYQIKLVTQWLETNKVMAKPADKNLGLVLLPIQWYNNEVLRQLSDKETYEPMQFDQNNVRRELQKLIHKHKLADYRKEIFPSHDKTKLPEFYILPKIHKPIVKGRPIVPQIETDTTNLSKWLHKHLSEMLKQFPWVVKSSPAVIENLEQLNPLEYNKGILVTFDVESLYTNLVTNHCTFWIHRWMTENGHSDNHADMIRDMLTFVLNNNHFEYNGIQYHQKKGTAMGTNVAPDYANLFLATEERHVLEAYPELKDTYKRFIDDGFFIWLRPAEELPEFFEFMKDRIPFLNFTYETKEELPFLDLSISIARNSPTRCLNIKMYEKSFNLHNYTSPDSNYPDRYKYSWITGENIRILRNSSSENEFNRSISNYKNWLQLAGYEKSIVKRMITEKYSRRQYWINSGLRVHPDTASNDVIIQPFTPGWGLVQSSLRKCIKQLNEYHHGLTDLKLPQVSVILKQGTNLSSYLNKTNKVGLLAFVNQNKKHLIRSSLKRTRSFDLDGNKRISTIAAESFDIG